MNETLERFFSIVGPGTIQTLYMLFLAVLFSVLVGLILAIFLFISKKEGLKPNKILYGIIDTFINLISSFPFIILVVSLIPITRLLLGTSIGTGAAIFPLTIAGAANAARIFEGTFSEIDKNIIEAAQSFGASITQIIFKVVIVESLPSLVMGIANLSIISLGMAAMSGTVGGGGLGSVALIYGYQSFNKIIMYGTVVVLLILVFIIRMIGNRICNTLRS